MSTKNRKLQVFVSSTYVDLKEERQAAVEAILNTGHIPAGMELFAAGDQSQMQVIRDWIQESDVYMLILGGRYGSINPETDKSYTQLEYEYALEIGKPHFAVVISEKGEDLKVERQGKKALERDHSEKYNEFKKLVTTSKMVKFWDDTSGIELAIFKSLSEFNKREELVGWVRGDQAVNNVALTEELLRLGKENSELRNENEIERFRINSVNDFEGISFDELFQILENKKFSLKSIENEVRWTYETECIPSLENFCSSDEVSANDMIVAFSPIINGIHSTAHDKFNGFYNFIQGYNLIKFMSRQSNIVAEFTDLGRRYLNRLRFLEKYK